jgi:hypothetical protein
MKRLSRLELLSIRDDLSDRINNDKSSELGIFILLIAQMFLTH